MIVIKNVTLTKNNLDVLHSSVNETKIDTISKGKSVAQKIIRIEYLKSVVTII
tara:strand:+ start:1538 stop:1696 length:159 start_codon:yes stop_codon:yes gene_type:complete